MTVVQFPKAESRGQRLQAIEACLTYLQTEANFLDLPMLAHIIGVAREEARESRPHPGPLPHTGEGE